MDGQIDVENLICELHHIAGTESVDADIRRTACDAESALASLRAWVLELQPNTREREAIRFAMSRLYGTLRGNEECDHADALQGLLDRLTQCAIH